MVQYDPKLIYQFADRLYTQANTIIALSTIIGTVIGGVVGYTLSGVAAIIGLVFLGGIGYYIGTELAFSLKLKAQMALCQVKIEENTRKQ